MRYYFTNQTIDRHKAREIELKIEASTGLDLDNPFYDGDQKEARELDSTGKSNLSAEEICGRDLKRIRDCEGLLAYMSHDKNIGSCMEIAICGHSWGKPVYVIAIPEHIRKHPWIIYFATRIFDNHHAFIKWYLETHNKCAKRGGWVEWVRRSLAK